MTQTEETIMVYPNRHLRANRLELNDVNQNRYISYRSVRLLAKTGVRLKFVKVKRVLEDVTEEMNRKIALDLERQAKQNQPKRKFAIREDFDPYGRKKA